MNKIVKSEKSLYDKEYRGVVLRNSRYIKDFYNSYLYFSMKCEYPKSVVVADMLARFSCNNFIKSKDLKIPLFEVTDSDCAFARTVGELSLEL
ncbi:hypothetical protein D3C81_2007500 [compost metagenome]